MMTFFIWAVVGITLSFLLGLLAISMIFRRAGVYGNFANLWGLVRWSPKYRKTPLRTEVFSNLQTYAMTSVLNEADSTPGRQKREELASRLLGI